MRLIRPNIYIQKSLKSFTYMYMENELGMVTDFLEYITYTLVVRFQ